MLLELRQVVTGYGRKQVLFDFSMDVEPREIVAIIGPNGAGKSTVLKAVCGLLPVWEGHICFNGRQIDNSSPRANVIRGITYCPQGNRVFSALTVKENLQMGGFPLLKREWKPRADVVLALFPRLKERLKQNVCTLSGGEQQMLSVARALMPKPRLLLLDEPSLGLAPGLIKGLFDKINEIQQQGVAIVIVEQKVREVLRMCSRVYSLKLGRVAFTGPPSELHGQQDRLRDLFL